VLLPDTTIDATIARRWYCFALGVALVVLPRLIPRVHSTGVFTGLTLIALSVFSLVLTRWRTDTGLWMLSSLILTIYGPVYVFYQWLSCIRIFQKAAPQKANAWQIAEAVDAVIALLLFGFLVRFVLTITIRNWAVSHRNSTDAT
jgi:hypothetical protein